MGLAVNSAAGGDASRNGWVKADFLFESVVSDLHLAALEAGGFTMMLTARAAADATWTLNAWRSRLHGDCDSMQLSLRYHNDIGMPAAMAARIAEVYVNFARATAETPVDAGRSNPDRTALAHSAEQWRRLCAAFGAALEAQAAETRRRLPAPYGEDGQALIAFLREAAAGDVRRVSRFGEIKLPQLRQRRSAPRAAVRHACTLITPGGKAAAEIEDVSRNGLGLRCRQSLRVGEEVVIEVAGGRRLTGIVARVGGEVAGIRLGTTLPANDPLFGRVVG
jgi:hypothetical protein